jgi:hypothetical protein
MTDESTTVTDPSAFSERSLGKQVLFSIITFGIYIIYWFHITHKQLAKGTDADFSATWRTIGMFIPIYNFIVLWRDGQDCEAVTDQDGVILFILFIVFSPAAWYLIQTGINGVAAGAES